MKTLGGGGARRLALLAALVVVLGGVAGPVRAASPGVEENPWYRLDQAGEVQVSLWFGWTSTCPYCQRAIPVVDRIAQDLPWVDVRSLQLDGPDGAAHVETLVRLAAGVGQQIGGVPAFLYAGQLRTGFDAEPTTGAEIRRDLIAFRAAVRQFLDGSSPAPTTDPGPAPTQPAPEPTPAAPISLPFIGPIDAATMSLPLLAVMLGGLDAFNPCAMSVLLFLMSVLVGTRSRRRILLIGGIFVFVSGFVYFVLMAAWLNLFLAFGALRLVTVLAGAAAIVAALINIKDFAWYGHGPSLVIPGSARPAIFGRILDLSEATRLRVVIGSTILVAAVANAYEMLCTGGFPVVFTRVLTLNELPTAAYYGYLVLYNLVYVTPLLAIVLFFTWSLGSGRVGEIEARRLKLLSGLLMLGFGILLLFMPERLGDLGATLGLFVAALAVWLFALLVTRRRGRLQPPTQPRVARR
jgi:thiol-disulfide isomerase/thioredoxin